MARQAGAASSCAAAGRAAAAAGRAAAAPHSRCCASRGLCTCGVALQGVMKYPPPPAGEDEEEKPGDSYEGHFEHGKRHGQVGRALSRSTRPHHHHLQRERRKRASQSRLTFTPSLPRASTRLG